MEFFNIVIDIFTLPLYAMFFLVLGKFFYGDLRKSFEEPYLCAFLEIVLGFMLTIVSYAIIKTSGKSIMVLFLCLLVFQYAYLNIRPDLGWYRKIRKTDIKTIGLLFGFALIVLGVQLVRHDYFNSDIVKLGCADFGFYSDAAESFNYYGIEKTMSWYNYFTTDGLTYNQFPNPYHHFDIWNQALFLTTALNSGVFVFIYMLIPFVGALVALAFFVMGRSLFPSQSIYKTPVLLFVAILMVYFIGKTHFFSTGFLDNVVYFPRNYMFYVLFIVFFLVYQKGFKIVAVYFLGMLSCINILYLPTVSIVLVLLAVLQYFRESNNGKLVLHTLFSGVFPAVFVFVFYFVIYKNEGGGSINMSVFGDINLYLLEGLKRYFRGYLARTWLFYLPCFLVSLMYLWKIRKNIKNSPYAMEIIFVSIALYLISLVFTSFVPHVEAFSFHRVVLNPMLAVLTFVSLIYVLKRIETLTSKILGGLFFLQLIYSFVAVLLNIDGSYFIGPSFNKAFLKEVAELQINNKVGAFYENEERRLSTPFRAKSNVSPYSAIFDVSGNGFFQIDLSTYIREDRIPFKSIAATVMRTPMFKYGSAKLTKWPELSRITIEEAFIEEYNIEYIIFNPETPIPNYLFPRVKKILKDDASKVQLVILKD